MEPTPITKVPKELATELQRGLKAFGLYHGAIDGVPGNGTSFAWQTWKQKNWLNQPLIVGDASLQLFRTDLGVHPDIKDEPTISSLTLKRRIPGIKDIVAATDRIYNGSNFTWGEATKNFARLPDSPQEVSNIIRMAGYMDKVRAFLGNRPISISSWFRPEPHNKQVGGVSNSQHVPGLAVDFNVIGLHPREVQKRLNQWHGAKGGLGLARSFTHIDIRGHYARFPYADGR